jgi:CRISPR system Cascade subunit CasB
MENKRRTVYGTMKAILTQLNSPQEQKNLSGNLATIRNSTGKDFEDADDVWPILFPLIPQEFLGKGALTYEEKALFVTLQLYAIGQQGTNKMRGEDKEGNLSMGASLRYIRSGDSTGLDRRFNAMLTATTFDEFVYHLRQIFKLGKSKDGFFVNFPALAEDLYWYQQGRNKQVCLKWARDYYRTYTKEENNE